MGNKSSLTKLAYEPKKIVTKIANTEPSKPVTRKAIVASPSKPATKK